MLTGLPAPVRLMRAGLRTMPPAVLALLLRRITAALARNHPTLLRRLGRLAPASVLFAPTDLPHRFLLTITEHGITLALGNAATAADVTMRGTLATLIDLLEGRIDSDTVFFSRALAVSGDTSIAVGFRNTLDGETINLTDDALAQLGPLAPAAGRVAVRLHRRIDTALHRLAALREAAHQSAHGGHDPVADRHHMRAALDDLALRVGKLEDQRRHARGAA
jgi:predicted lipid carrier protein YhbT